MDALHERLDQNHDKYSSELVDIQRVSVQAWVAYAEGKTEEALRQMRAAAGREDITEKLPVTPGVLVPARELLGEMLLAAKQPAAALEAFETSLKFAPGRFNSLVGAARSAQLSGDRQKAAKYFSELLANCPHADPDIPEIGETKLFLNRK
jgi:tetratricopeptide (TPR) repeat protein